MKKIGILVLILVFALASSAFASEQWLVVKGKDGKCKLMKTKPNSPVIVAGPFDKKEAAEQALKTQCPKTEKK